MKRILTISIALILIAGCAKIPKKVSCPRDNVIYFDSGGRLQWVPEGFFDGESGPGGYYMTEKQYNKIIEELKRKGGM